MAESERLDELFKYFESAQDILDADIDAPAGYNPDLARLSRDPVLNALAQLGVSRLQCDRAFVSLIDDRNQYVVAEVSQSTPLLHTDYQPHDGGLAIGVRVLDLVSGVCAATMPAFTDPSGTNHILSDNIFADTTCFVIKDFTAASKYQSRAYVAGFPFMRFYAGVPIRSKSGHAIGTYAVVDNKPRQELSDDDFRIMNEIASTIMRHLELLQTQSGRDDAFNALRGIKSLMQDSANLAGTITNGDPSKSPKRELIPGTVRAVLVESGCENGTGEIGAGSTGFPSIPTSASEIVVSQSTEAADSTSPILVPQSRTVAQSGQYKKVLAQAASRVQEAMRMDEVLFVPASSISGDDRSSNLQSEIVSGLGRCNLDTDGTSKNLYRELLSRYPNGSYLNFANHHGVSSTTIHGQSLDKHKQSIETIIRATLPLVESLMWLPLYTLEHKDCPWAMIAWSSNARRILLEEDFSYLTLFGVAIQSDFARTKAAIQNRAKSDFISSISHELRSPLHGILGNAELLLGSDIEEEQRQMVLMVEKCGRSLLSTMEHILCHSKINNHTMSLRGEQSEMSKQLQSIDLSTLIEDSVGIIMSGSQFRSLTMTGSGPETQRNGLPKNQSLMSSNDTRREPTISLHIDHQPSWTVLTDPAVWSRCVMNILSNALKYTASGCIEVRLDILNVEDKGFSAVDLKTVKLSIKDTGRGMSPEYLREHLYQPFRQEHNTSDGLGLGLSIVKKLVDSVNGTMAVQSKVDEGTTVEIFVPLEVRQVEAAARVEELIHRGRKICLVLNPPRSDFDEVEDRQPTHLQDGNFRTRASLIYYCKDWYNMEISYCTMDAIPEIEVLVMSEDTRQALRVDNANGATYHDSLAQHALVILSNHYQNEEKPASERRSGLFYLRAPFGPCRVASVLEQAYQYIRNLKDGVLAPMPSRFQDSRGSTLETQKEAKFCPTNLTENSEGNTSPSTKSSSKIKSDSDEAEPRTIDTCSHEQRKSTATQVKPSATSDGYVTTDSTRAPGASKHVLIVDDNQINVMFLERCLQRRNINYQTASDGAMAVKVFQNAATPFNFVLMDISMPVMNGIEATRAIRQWEGAQKLKARSRIVALTGLSDERTREEALVSGMDHFITKPFTVEAITDLLRAG